MSDDTTRARAGAAPATDAGTTTSAGEGAATEDLQRQVAEQTDSLSPNAGAAGTRERAVDPDQSGD